MMRSFFVLVVCMLVGTPSAFGQIKETVLATSNTAAVVAASAMDKEADEPNPAEEAEAEAALPGLKLPNSDKLRVRLGFLAGYGKDQANAAMGFEQQGRVGYAKVTIEGRPNSRVFYRLTVNPVNETAPLPGCGEEGYFYPNNPGSLYATGPNVPCSPKNGNRRVDAYRGIALDVVSQQDMIREAFVDLSVTKSFAVRFGRTLLPLGFDWEQAGSFTAKDAPRIQRINAESNFGVMFNYDRKVVGRTKPLFSASAAGFLGDGNRWYDYDYFYFEDGTLDSNSALTAMIAGSFSPLDAVTLHASYKKGFTGSKVERLPNYWASKRHDDALVLGASYENRFVSAFGEYAKYQWGITATSAGMIGAGGSPVEKAGYWGTIEGRLPISSKLTIGASLTREEVDRADSLIRYLSENHLYNVVEGKKDRMNVLRFFVDISSTMRLGFYRTHDSNPFPQASGITPISGPNAYKSAGTDKWGIVMRVSVE